MPNLCCGHVKLSVTSVADDENDNEVTPGGVHTSPDIYLTTEERN